MSADSTHFPLVDLHFVADARNDWVALTMRVHSPGPAETALRTVFADAEVLTAIAPLDCVLLLDSCAVLSPALLEKLPTERVVLSIAAAALAGEGELARLTMLHALGYRIMLDGALPAGVAAPARIRSVSTDCSAAAPAPGSLPALFAPHLARFVGTGLRQAQCAAAGFTWFSGDYPMFPQPSEEVDDGSSRRRLLALLGLLGRDADTWELEALLKQDPALCFHLLKLVNSAAFALSTPITSFNQAIGMLGRRQMQRWLQLLLYARPDPDAAPNLLLPMAAQRGAQLEMLCKNAGGDRDAQDIAFMTGVFSLLDRLFALPMADVVRSLPLPEDVCEALLHRAGRLGRLLHFVEISPTSLETTAIGPDEWWRSQLHAYHWAIQVSRNV
ncbi:EAL and HDOD domain-containing protein [Massilia sp. S19_KUP03_FR1]|uniref:EAL and HDOD domain-containing protein n=1 Tax=Massilia sp. S19_KUP03_FR1 TaxID=3025503 RepID=UPI002FCDB854